MHNMRNLTYSTKNNRFLFFLFCAVLTITTVSPQDLFSPTLFLDKVVIVTGGASGIGREIVRSFAQHGACVVFVDNDKKRGDELLHELFTKYPESQHIFVCGNLNNKEICKQTIDKALRNFGHIDVLINNAGTNDKVGITASPQAFKKSVENNLMHYFMMAHYALDALKQSKGVIINIASKVALTGQGHTSGYAAAKGAILALTREWSVELASYGIRVNAILPAEVYTEAYQKWLSLFANPEQKLREIVKKIPFEQRMTTPLEIAHTVLFIASSLSSHTTGQFLSIDGGYVHLDRAL